MEQCFNLLYYIPGLTDAGLEQMTKSERDWWFERLRRQKAEEKKAANQKG